MADRSTTLRFPYHIRPSVCIVGALALVVLCAFMIGQTYFGQHSGSQEYRAICYFIGSGLMLGAICCAIQGVRVLIKKPHIVFEDTEVIIPTSLTLRTTVLAYRDIKNAVIGYHQDKRFINIERENGKPLCLSESVFFSKKQFEDCWGILDSLSGEGVQRNAIFDSYSIRVLCVLCGEPADSLNTEERCADCAGITTSDIRRLGIIAIAVGLVPLSIGVLSFVLTFGFGSGVVFTGLLVFGLLPIVAGLMLLITGRVNSSSLAMLKSFGFLSPGEKKP